jgi:hypothetical protein
MNRDDWDLYPLLIRLMRERQATVVLDVGANRGGFVDQLRVSGYEGRVISFEPLPEPYGVLAQRAAGDPRWDAAETALSDTAGPAVGLWRRHLLAAGNHRRDGAGAPRGGARRAR